MATEAPNASTNAHYHRWTPITTDPSARASRWLLPLRQLQRFGGRRVSVARRPRGTTVHQTPAHETLKPHPHCNLRSPALKDAGAPAFCPHPWESRRRPVAGCGGCDRDELPVLCGIDGAVWPRVRIFLALRAANRHRRIVANGSLTHRLQGSGPRRRNGSANPCDF